MANAKHNIEDYQSGADTAKEYCESLADGSTAVGVGSTLRLLDDLTDGERIGFLAHLELRIAHPELFQRSED